MRRVMMLLMIVAGGMSAAAQTGGASVTLTTAPTPLGLGQNRFEVSVKDAMGQPIADAQVVLSLVMPPDPKTKHPEMRIEGTLNNVGGGKYNGVAMVTMAGSWAVTAIASRNGRPIGQAKATLTAQATRPGATPGSAQPAAAQHAAVTHTHAAAAALKNPVPATPESVAGGTTNFARHCVMCHGAGAKGDGAMAAKLKVKPANLTDAEWKHGPSDGEIFTLIRDGAKNAGMKAFRGALTDRQIWDLVNYIRTLDGS